MMRSLVIMLSAILSLASGLAQETIPSGGTLAFLGMSYVDYSTEGAYFGKRADEAARLVLLENAVAERFRQEGFILLDLAPIAEQLAHTLNLAQCYGCELRMARKIGADYVLVGEVHKVSNLILSINLVMREVRSERIVRAQAVDIRGNNDKSWLRGIRYILQNHFFRP